MEERESPAERAARPRTRWLALALLSAAALGLRFTGLDHQLPHFIEPDLYVVMGAQRAVLERGEVRPAYVDARVALDNPSAEVWTRYYPPLLSALLDRLPGESIALPPGEPLTGEEHLRRAKGPILRGRALVALLASLLVPLTYALARRFLGPSAALLAAALIATSALHMWFAGTARPHAAAATPILLALVAALWLRRRPSVATYVAATAAAGLALGTLQTGLFVLPALLAAHLLRERSAGRGGPWGPLAAALVLAVSVHLSYPDLAAYLLRLDGPRHGAVLVEGGELYAAGQPLPLGHIGWPDPARIAQLAMSHDPALALAAALGAALLVLGGVLRSIRRRLPAAIPGARADLAVVAAHALPYLLVLSVYSRTVERYLLPLLPHAACLAAFAWSASGWHGRAAGRGRRRLAASFALLLLAFPTLVALRIAWLRSGPDTLEEAAAWIGEHAHPERDPPAYAAGRLPPLPFELEDVRRAMTRYHVQALRWPTYLANGARYPAGSPVWPLELTGWTRAGGTLEHLEGRLVVAESSRMVWAHPVGSTGLEALRGNSELVARFGPLGPGSGGGGGPELDREVARYGLEYSDMDRFIPRLLRARRLGPAVEIYRVGLEGGQEQH